MGLAFNGAAFKLKLIDLSNDAQVNSAGGTETQTLQPDPGYIYHIVSMTVSLPKPAGATANTHDLAIRGNDASSNTQGHASISSNFNADITISRTAFAGTSEIPSGVTQQSNLVHEYLWCNNTNYIEFVYTNDTDANQTGTRKLIILVQEYKEAV